jgi:hypothetical protein
MSYSINYYEIASDYIIKHYSDKGYKIDKFALVDPTTFSPITHYRYNDIVVQHKPGMIGQFDFTAEYWVKEIDKILLPIKRDMKLDDLGV